KKGDQVMEKDFETVTILFITDGHDTTSTHFSETGAKRLIAEGKEKGWQILFMGLDWDATDQAKRYGISPDQQINVDKTRVKEALVLTADARGENVSSGKAIAYSPEQKLLLGGPA